MKNLPKLLKSVKYYKFGIAGTLVTGLVLTGCGGSSTTSSGGTAPIRIGQATALTTEYTIEGDYLKHGSQMAVDEINAKGGINGRKIELIIEDSGNTNPMAVNAFDKLVNNDNVTAIIAPDLSTQLFAVMPIINKAKIPMLISGTNPKLTTQTEWYFRLRPSDSLAAEATAKFAVNSLHTSKIGILNDTDEYGSSGAKILQETLTKLGTPPVDIEACNSQDKDLSGQLTKLKNKGVDTIIQWTHGQQAAILMKQNKQLGFNFKIVSSAGANNPTVLKLAGDGAVETYAIVDTAPTQNQDSTVQDWDKRYQQKYNTEPDFHSAATYDAIYILASIMKDMKDITPENIKNAMSKVQNYKGIANDFDFSKSKDGARQVVAIQFTGGTSLKIIDTIKADQ